MMYGDYGDRVVLIDLSSNDGEKLVWRYQDE